MSESGGSEASWASTLKQDHISSFVRQQPILSKTIYAMKTLEGRGETAAQTGSVAPPADLRVPDESDADGQLALHPPGQGLGPGVALVLQVQHADDAIHFLRNLLPGVSLQLHGRGRGRG